MSTVSQTSRVLPLVEAPIARPSTVPGVYRAAARILAANGLYQDDYFPDPFDRRLQTPHAERPLSVVAAIRCAATGNPRQYNSLSEDAIRVLAYRVEVEGEPPWSDAPRWLENHVDCWSDVPGRSVESVVAVLEAAADAVEVTR